MADTIQSRSQIAPGYTGPRFFGAPIGDFSVFQTLLITIASGFVAFFATTFVAIMALLVLTAFGRKVDFAITYKYFGLPVGIAVMLAAGVFLTSTLISRIRRQSSSQR